MKITQSMGGRIVVEHEDGYEFVFQVHDTDGQVMNLEKVSWPISGPPPDADELEAEARQVAEAEARAQGWLWA